MFVANRITGFCGIAWFVVSLLALAVLSTTSLSETAMEAGDIDAIMTGMAANRSASIIALCLFVTSIVFAAGFGVGIADVLEGERRWLRNARLLVIIGATVFLLETLVSIGLAQVAAVPYAASEQAEQELLQVPLRALMQFRNNCALLGSTLLAIAALFFGAATLRKPGPLPRWSGLVIGGSGILGIAGSFTPLVPMLGTVRQTGLTGFSVWALITGVVLLRSKPDH